MALKQLQQVQYNFEQQLYQKLTLRQADIKLLMYLNSADQTLLELCRQTNLDMSTLSRQLKAMAQRDLVIKQAVQNDRRKRRFVITKLGRSKLNDFKSAMQDYEQAIFANWSAEEKQLLKVLLNRLITSSERLLTKKGG
uniref:Transcriptional regulator, MarR family n=1 Tax=Loigolactobacillus rennini TaxID=238013 RepID=A0A1K2I793_9LACO|nr:Transcriptional regulator, MarR family [Loigolactobacillus rennini]